MSEARVRAEDDGAVRILTLSRPEKKNAFDVPMASQLWAAIEAAEAAAGVRAIVVTAEGDYFSGGADVNIFLQMGSLDPRDVMKVGHLFEPLRACTKPTIAIVQGHAVGMGVTVLPHFDLVYAADHVTFRTPFVQLGLVLEYASSYTLTRTIGTARAKELVLRAAPLDAVTAERWGLVTRVFPREALRAEALTIAHDIAKNPPSAVADSKRLIDRGAELAFEAAVAAEEEVLMRRYGSPENVQAVMALMNRKRG